MQHALGLLRADVEHRAASHDRGRVDEHVEPPERGGGGLDRALAGVGVRLLEIELDERAAAAEGLDPRPRLGGIAAVDMDDVAARLGQRERGRLADAARRAGDAGDAAVEAEAVEDSGHRARLPSGPWHSCRSSP